MLKFNKKKLSIQLKRLHKLQLARKYRMSLSSERKKMVYFILKTTKLNINYFNECFNKAGR